MKTTNIQNVIIGALVCLSIILHLQVISHKNSNNTLSSVKDYLFKQNLDLKHRGDSLYNLYLTKELDYAKLDSILDNKTKQLDKLKLENNQLQLKLANLENEMANITSDSSYNYLMHRYIPTQDSLPYGFAPNQVKSIHYDVLVLDQTKLINNNLTYSLNTLDSLYSITTLKFDNCREQSVFLLEERDLLNNRINNLNLINNTYKKEVKKQKRKTTVIGLGLAGIVTYGIISSLSN